MRVGFLLLGPQTHIHHCASIAFELSALPGLEVTLLVSCQMNADTVSALAASYGSRCRIEWLRAGWANRLMRSFKKRLHPRASSVVAHNRVRLSEFDALVSTDQKPVRGLDPQPLLICVPHGMGDRALGFNPEMRDFDLMLVSGTKTWRRMESLGYVAEGRGAIIGSPKFDLARLDQAPAAARFGNRNPVVLYNPHFNPDESSWPLWGRQVLDYFLDSREFNLIFAPHMLLFGKGREVLVRRYLDAPNILVDTDSPALSDMTYTRAADIYLGDVSSQVYEFVACRRRPCLFLNAHQVAWQGREDFTMWRMGAVLDDIGRLDFELRAARGRLSSFLPEQEALLHDTLSLESEGAGKRGARAIEEFVRLRKVRGAAAASASVSDGLPSSQQE